MEYDIEIDTIRNKFFYKKGTNILHREDGPAVITKYGDGYRTEWYINGNRHRENAPAVEYKFYKGYWDNGKRHRADGPAREWDDGTKEWFINGERLSAEKEEILNIWWDNKNDKNPM